jgi:hypothetical protein
MNALCWQELCQPLRQCGQVFVGGHERADDELAGPDGGDLGADLFDDAAVLVSYRGGTVGGLLEPDVAFAVQHCSSHRSPFGAK